MDKEKGVGLLESWCVAEKEMRDAAGHLGVLIRWGLYDKFSGISVIQPKDEFLYGKSVSLELTPDELENAPESIKKILEDLGIKPTDKVNAEFSIHDLQVAPGFQFALKPCEITEERLGIRLSTDGESSIIGPVYQTIRGPIEVTECPLIPHCKKPFMGKMAADLHDDYTSIVINNVNRRKHPYMIEIMTDAANWGRNLINTRKDPQVTQAPKAA